MLENSPEVIKKKREKQLDTMFYNIYLLLRNLYADQEATVRTGHGATDWFGKGVR